METVCQQSAQPMEIFIAPKAVKAAKAKATKVAKHKLPADPRQWSREHVHLWLEQIAAAHNLQDVQASRFAMNGKALCLMTAAMFAQRVPVGGKLLYRDFQLRLTIAIHSNPPR